MYDCIADNEIEDLSEVKEYTMKLAQAISAGRRKFVKCDLIGVGERLRLARDLPECTECILLSLHTSRESMARPPQPGNSPAIPPGRRWFSTKRFLACG